jgi:hypothetical protein
MRLNFSPFFGKNRRQVRLAALRGEVKRRNEIKVRRKMWGRRKTSDGRKNGFRSHFYIPMSANLNVIPFTVDGVNIIYGPLSQVTPPKA